MTGETLSRNARRAASILLETSVVGSTIEAAAVAV